MNSHAFTIFAYMSVTYHHPLLASRFVFGRIVFAWRCVGPFLCVTQ